MYSRNFTPERISSLAPNEVFVFGSNLQGYHGGGAARVARDKFGAVWGQGVGLQGQSYAIPTMHGGVETIKPYVDEFIEFAREHQNLVFYVTRIGCGIAGFKDSQIAPLFKEAIEIENIILPESFVTVLDPAPKMPKAIKDMLYGQTRTLVDILKEMDKKEPIGTAEEAGNRLREFMDMYQRSGDETGFMAQRTIWNLLYQYEQEGLSFDLDRLEKDMYAFHERDGRGHFGDELRRVYYNYCAAKIVRYVSFLNSFRRYKDFSEVYSDLHTVDNNHCGENNHDYFFSFDEHVVWMLRDAFHRNSESLFKDDHLDNEALERIFFKNHQELVDALGVDKMIEEHYENVGCHSSIKAPAGSLVGPVYKRNRESGQFEVSCHGTYRPLIGRTWFETKKATELLESDPRYVAIGHPYDRYFIPVDDFSLPIISTFSGILEFDSEREKRRFIADLKRRNEPGC